MPYRYPHEFRRRVLDLIAAGRSVASIAVDLGASDQTMNSVGYAQSILDDGTAPQREWTHPWAGNIPQRVLDPWVRPLRAIGRGGSLLKRRTQPPLAHIGTYGCSTASGGNWRSLRLAGNRCRHLPDISIQIAVVAYRDAVTY